MARSFLAAGLLILALATLSSCDDEDNELEDTEEPAGPVSTQPQIPTPSPQAPVTGPALKPVPPARDLPEITTQADVLFTDLATAKVAFEVEVEPQYGDQPKGSIVPVEEERDLEELVRGNLRHIAEQGFTQIEVFAVEGFGALFLRSRVLEALHHEGFDYDAQYEGAPAGGDLAVDEKEARQRYYSVGDVLPMVVGEAHAIGLKVTALIESLAHIINRADASGIGGSGLILSGNLPPPSVAQVLEFVDEVLATGVDAISAEAFPGEYDVAIADHLATKGVPYVHTGADLGTVWYGYYYSFYPDSPKVGEVYSFLHSADALLGTTNGTVFARARALSTGPETAVVVGAYNPLPCDTSISLADVHSAGRAIPIDESAPALADGTPVENCATGPWKNLLLVAARRQGVDRILLTADLPASVAATSQPGIGREILQRIASHPSPGGALPIANIVFDLPSYGADDGYTNQEVFEAASVGVVGVVDDALQAAGYQTVLTYDRPWTGGKAALTYIITAGGNEDTGDGYGVGPPYWSSAQDLQPELLTLLDTGVHPGPVFIHPLFGVPEGGPRDNPPGVDLGESWQKIRDQFGLPTLFAYRNPSLSRFEEYHTSLLTSMPVTPDGDVAENIPWKPITPETGTVLGRTVTLSPYSDFYGLGHVASFARPDEIAPGGAIATGPLLVPDAAGSLEEKEAAYLVTDGDGRYLWLINQLHHEAFTFIVGQAVEHATVKPAVLAEPTKAHVWSGAQTFAFAYDRTEVSLRLPLESGQPIDVTVYDMQSNPIREDRNIPYEGLLKVDLDKYSLLVVEPARR